ncbi:MAG: response regulator transcription factor [bacterium]|nr:response regulator transcription factor [bacterium]
MNAIKIVLVEDNQTDRATLVKAFQESGWIKVVHTFMTGIDFINYFSENKIDFEVAVIDYRMPFLNGLDTIRNFHYKNRGTKMLLVSHGYYSQVMSDLYVLGLQNYCRKSPEIILKIIPLVITGQSIYKNSTKDITWEALSNKDMLKQLDESNWTKRLSPLEKKIIRLMASGKNSETIGRILGYETSSIEKYRGNILKNLNLSNSQQLVAFAISHGIVSPSSLFCDQINPNEESPLSLFMEQDPATPRRGRKPKKKK